VKAITYSNMQIIAPGGKFFTANDGAEVTNDDAGAEGKGEGAAKAEESASAAPVSATHKRRAPYEVFVIVDI
jgi:hypothetical protein